MLATKTPMPRTTSRTMLSPCLLDRYVAREFMVGYLIVMLAVLALRVLIDLFVMFDEFIEAQVGQVAPSALTVLGYIADYYGPKLFEYFRDFSGVMVILAAAFSVARMTRQNELTAVLTSGVSLKRVIAPIVFLGLALNLLMALDQELILPRLSDKLVRYHDEMGQFRKLSAWLVPDKVHYLQGSPQQQLNQKVQLATDKALLSAFTYDPGTQTMLGMHVILRNDRRLIGHLTADEARWDAKYQDWQLVNGRYFNYEQPEPGRPNVGLMHVYRYKSDLTADYLYLQRNKEFKGLMSSADLTDLLSRQLRPADHAEAISEKHFRFTDPVINMVMLLLALPLLVSRERRSTKTAIFLALLGAGGCFVATFACKLLAGDVLPPLLAAWLPIIVFVPVSVFTLDGLKT